MTTKLLRTKSLSISEQFSDTRTVITGRLPQTRRAQPTNFHPELIVDAIFRILDHVASKKRSNDSQARHPTNEPNTIRQSLAVGRRPCVWTSEHPSALGSAKTIFFSSRSIGHRAFWSRTASFNPRVFFAFLTSVQHCAACNRNFLRLKNRTEATRIRFRLKAVKSTQNEREKNDFEKAG